MHPSDHSITLRRVRQACARRYRRRPDVHWRSLLLILPPSLCKANKRRVMECMAVGADCWCAYYSATAAAAVLWWGSSHGVRACGHRGS